jgi:hypothetical protein
LAEALVFGVLAGGAAGVKLTGMAVIVIPCVLFVGRGYRSASQHWKALAFYLVVAIAVALPFYLRPWLLKGNPFYPYFAQWFTSDAARIEMSRYHHAIGGAAFGVKSLAGFAGGPLLLAFRTENYDGSFGWQLLMFVGLAALALATLVRRSRRRGLVLWAAAVWLWLYAAWYFTAQQARFAVPAMVGLVILAALGLQQLKGHARKLALTVLAASAIICLPWRSGGYYLGSWLTVSGRASRTYYVDVNTDRDHLPLIEELRDRTPADARVMLLFEHRGFYVPRDYVIGTPFFQEAGFTPPERFDDVDPIMELLQRERITHLVVAKEVRGPDVAADWLPRLPTLARGIERCNAAGRLPMTWESDRYRILAVK